MITNGAGGGYEMRLYRTQNCLAIWLQTRHCLSVRVLPLIFIYRIFILFIDNDCW